MSDTEWVRLDDYYSSDAGYEEPAASPNGGAPDATPLFTDSHDFVNLEVEPPVPLWGSPDVPIISAGGLGLLAGRPGAGKTTFVLDLACHLAAGLAYPPADADDSKAPTPWPCPRPLRIALIENEGPQEMFRNKLKKKLARFPGQVPAGGLLIQTWRWGSYSFGSADAWLKAQAELDAHGVDLVIGDPLGTLGPEGAGAPSETLRFVDLLTGLGLKQHRAFLFLHHFREKAERNEDELARISGAWGPHLDTLLTLMATEQPDQARLAYRKLRWASVAEPHPVILGRVYTTATFEAIAEEGDAAVLEPAIAQHMAEAHRLNPGQAWATSGEHATALKIKRAHVQQALDGAPHLFAMVTGAQAKLLGRRATAQLWGLAHWLDDEPAEAPRHEQATIDDAPVDKPTKEEDEFPF